MCNVSFDIMMQEIVEALRTKGYNPAEQLKGYVSLGNESYITRYNGAREKIKQLDKEQIRNYIMAQGW